MWMNDTAAAMAATRRTAADVQRASARLPIPGLLRVLPLEFLELVGGVTVLQPHRLAAGFADG